MSIPGYGYFFIDMRQQLHLVTLRVSKHRNFNNFRKKVLANIKSINEFPGKIKNKNWGIFGVGLTSASLRS